MLRQLAAGPGGGLAAPAPHWWRSPALGPPADQHFRPERRPAMRFPGELLLRHAPIPCSPWTWKVPAAAGRPTRHRNFARLVDALLTSLSPCHVQPQDARSRHLRLRFRRMVKNTNKPIVFIAKRAGRGPDLRHRLLIAAPGGLRGQALILNYSEAISPCASPKRHGQGSVLRGKEDPLCFPSGSNAGGGAR